MDSELRFLLEIGPKAREELLMALTDSEERRAARIGRLHARSAEVLAELLTEYEINEPARLQTIAALREMQEP